MIEEVDRSALPFWALIAYLSKCARRCAESYLDDPAEPRAAQVAVDEAIVLAESRAARGGDPEAWEGVMEIDGRFFDRYDVEALSRALDAYRHAAWQTCVDLNDAVSRMNLAAIDLARLALSTAFAPRDAEGLQIVDPKEALDVIGRGDERLVAYAEADLFLLERLSEEGCWTDESSVAAHVFQSPLPSD